MKIDGKHYRSIWQENDRILIIDQTFLPHEVKIIELQDLAAVTFAIREMQVRGAPLIGATAAYGLGIAMQENASDTNLADAFEALLATRPTAVNLRWALERMRGLLSKLPSADRPAAAMAEAAEIANEDVAINEAIGNHGLEVMRTIVAAKKDNSPINILTHCNAGWIATVDWGTALAPIYKAIEAGIDLHVWVDETRPRNQGAALTAWELGAHGVPHHVIVDNAGGHLMQRGLVDLCIVGTDRTTAAGDVCNKIGTYLKAVAAKDNGIPFYVALPTPTIDWTIEDGLQIPIEQRAAAEVTHVWGQSSDGSRQSVLVTPAKSPARNDAFDVTPARLVTGLITEVGVIDASPAGLASIRKAAA
jgi:methylthioribose-1-phosphate isomerase